MYKDFIVFAYILVKLFCTHCNVFLKCYDKGKHTTPSWLNHIFSPKVQRDFLLYILVHKAQNY